MPQILDGKWVRDQILAEWKDRAAALAKRKRQPGLAVVLVGADPASEIYVRNKIKACEQMGVYSEKHTPPESVRPKNCSRLVESLNQREEIDGILVQMPLPQACGLAAYSGCNPAGQRRGRVPSGECRQPGGEYPGSTAMYSVRDDRTSETIQDPDRGP